MLIISLSPRDAEVEHFLQMGVPTVLVDAHHPRLNRVVIADVDGGRMATQHLVDLGHRRIGYVSDLVKNPFNFVSSRERGEGYRQALAQADIPFRPEYHRQGDYGREQARRMALELLSLPERPTAIFAASDTLAIGVMQAAREMGLRVPYDLSVVGYDDIEVSEYLHLTTVRQPFFVSGVEGVELLLDTITDAPPTPRESVLPVELIARGTTAPLD
jgi:DNA-binding LacI/PurR family transcriptional regulator